MEKIIKTPAHLMEEAQKKRIAEAQKRAEELRELAIEQHANNLKETEEFKAEIKEYLASEQQFDEGFVLLTRFNSNRCLLDQVLRKQMQSKVIYELEKLLDKEIIKQYLRPITAKPLRKVMNVGTAYNKLRTDDTAPTLAIVLTDEQRKEALDEFLHASGSGVNPAELPEVLKEYYDKACKYYHIFRHWHEVMKLAKTDAERKAAIEMMQPAEDYKTECWRVIDAWVKDGTLPGQKPAAKETEAPAELAEEIMQAKSYITKLLKTLETKQGKKYEEQKAKLQERVSLLQKHNLVPKVHTEMLLKHGLITEN